MNYNEFLHTKIEVALVSGFEVRPEDINPALKPHQRDPYEVHECREMKRREKLARACAGEECPYA